VNISQPKLRSEKFDDDDNNNNNNICRDNKTALVIDIGAPLTHTLSITEAEKITKHDNLFLEI
jgi:hypothetical protein